jgi:major membrane immunogen (membrane-anchored lipoprotein)
MKYRIGVLLVAVLLAGCGESTTEDSAADQSGLACNHFRNVAGDIADGVLTDAEAREKLKEIDDNAVIATPRIQSAARGMLAAMTAGDIAKLTREARRMDRACSAAGH